MGAARRTPARKHVAPAYHRPGAREFAFSAGARSEQQVPLRLPVERQRQRRIDRERHLVAANRRMAVSRRRPTRPAHERFERLVVESMVSTNILVPTGAHARETASLRDRPDRALSDSKG